MYETSDVYDLLKYDIINVFSQLTMAYYQYFYDDVMTWDTIFAKQRMLSIIQQSIFPKILRIRRRKRRRQKESPMTDALHTDGV